MINVLNKEIKAVESKVIGWRRDMYKHPELSYEEHWTSDYVEQALR